VAVDDTYNTIVNTTGMTSPWSSFTTIPASPFPMTYIIAYEWDFGEGKIGSSVTTTHG
jgi:hypothetical protein